LTTLWWPAPPREMVGTAEHRRTSRNGSVATIVSAASTFAGAVVLLVRSEWVWAFLGVVLSAGLYYGLLAAWTRSEWVAIRRQIVREREHGDGRITVNTANWMGLLNDTHAESSMASHFMNNVEFGAHAQLVAERNSRWRWALRHPRGGGWDRRNI